jgi:hypothetical protein
MKKIIALLAVLFFIGIAANAQTASRVNKMKAKKSSTKNKILDAVKSDKAKTAVYKAKQPARKEGE